MHVPTNRLTQVHTYAPEVVYGEISIWHISIVGFFFFFLFSIFFFFFRVHKKYRHANKRISYFFLLRRFVNAFFIFVRLFAFCAFAWLRFCAFSAFCAFGAFLCFLCFLVLFCTFGVYKIFS